MGRTEIGAGRLRGWLVQKVAEVLRVEAGEVDPAMSFDAHGIGSTDAVSISGQLEEWAGVTLSPTALYEHPTIDDLVAFLTGARRAAEPPGQAPPAGRDTVDDPVCVVGMACRFPGSANSPDLYWGNLIRGVDAGTEVPRDRWDARRFYDEAPDAPGRTYTRQGGFIDDIAGFDAAFFGISPREALRMDPQQRQLLEVTWEALENAGIGADRLRGSSTGVFVGMMANDQYASLQLDRSGREILDDPYFGLGTAPSVVTGRISYLLDLRGPSVLVDTACSSALVAVDLAAQSLSRGDCSLAVVGGVSATLHPDAYVQACKMRMLARDGRCKTFDRAADGFLMGEGCGVVVLERMSEALRRGHRIHAVIRGSAVNQDGASNGLTAPNGAAQSAVIRAAQSRAGVTPAMVGYVEAHGSGTLLGDAIEMGALHEVFGADRPADLPLVVGAVKTNVGHLIGASGMAGFIKAVLALAHGEIPPNLHHTDPNPAISWDGSPTLLPDAPTPWPARPGGRIAGVSSFGWSGTNAHVVVERSPDSARPPAPARSQLLALSARTDTALVVLARRLREHLTEEPAPDLQDVAFTLQKGRSALDRRATLVCGDVADARRALEEFATAPRARKTRTGQRVALLLPGTGDQYPGMGRGLYDGEPAFREAIDECAEILAGPLGLDLRTVLHPASAGAPAGASAGGDLRALLGRGGAEDTAPGTAVFERVDVAHAAIFAMDYAMARLLMAAGVQASGLLGYSLGEYVAACLAGVFSLEDALQVVVRRARLLERSTGGMMLTVAQPREAVEDRLTPGVWLAADVGPLMSVLAGEAPALTALAERLAGEGIACRRVPNGQAMHTPMLDPLRDDLKELVGSVVLNEPSVPFVSNRTGEWITPEQARDPEYWAEHMCRTVHFADGVRTLADSAELLVEAGPGQLTSMGAQVLAQARAGTVCLPSIRPARDGVEDRAFLLRTLGRLWESGVNLDWDRLHGGADPRVVPLPTYPFEHHRFWPAATAAASTVPAGDGGTPALERARPSAEGERQVAEEERPSTSPEKWLHAPEWQLEPPVARGEPVGPFLVFALQEETFAASALGLPDEEVCATVLPGTRFSEPGPGLFTVRPGDRADYEELLRRLAERDRLPRTVLHAWLHDGERDASASTAAVRSQQRLGLSSLVVFGKVFAPSCHGGLRILVVTDRGSDVVRTGALDPGKATVAGACLVLPQEHPGLSCRWLDLAEGTGPASPVRGELAWPGDATFVAYRDHLRFVRRFTAVRAEPRPAPVYRDGGVYLITGGLGHIGGALARHIAATVREPCCVLVGRTGLPPRDRWPALLEAGTDDVTATRIRKVLELEDAGARVRVEGVDLTDPDGLRALVGRVGETFGPLDGVVHAAGLTSPDFFETVRDLRPETVEAHFAAKLYGTLALAEALEGVPLDFCAMLSSMSAVLGGLGFTAYSAANAFLDQYTVSANRGGDGRWLSVNWDTWRPDDSETGGTMPGDSLARYSMSEADGLAVFDRTLALGHDRLVVATGDLDSRLAAWARSTDPFGESGSGNLPDLYPRPALDETFIPAKTDYERRVAALWRTALGIDEVGVNDNFFDLGGNSLIGTQLVAALVREFGIAVPAVAIFEAPTIAAMARYLLPEAPGTAVETGAPSPGAAEGPAEAVEPTVAGDIAVIGMACRFPGAADVGQFWENLAGGVESIRFFTPEELAEAGVPEEYVRRPNYVPARPVLEDVSAFDAEFFGYSPWEAKLTDPQHRVFLECSWEALENAGYAPRSYAGSIGVFTGANISTYLPKLYEDPATAATLNDYQVVISNDKDALPLSVSYKLNLRGPSIAVQTFCSTSLVATHLACRAILAGECDMALAGGVSIRVPDRAGHFYEEGGMESPDGHVRTFDAAARGAVFGDGAGVVVLKRLSDALADGDSVAAVIKGTAVNNDGSLKVGFTAPSVAGQAAVVARALEVAAVDPRSISYVEAHGTATELGDPIEVAALTKAFGIPDRPGTCALGSVKTNIGHLDRAAGAAGLIKTVLALRHRRIPPTLHFQEPNPALDLDAGPFYVNDRLSEWEDPEGRPLRAGVTSLGMGGTNAHVVLEEAPRTAAPAATPEPGPPGPERQIVVLSARTQAALAEIGQNLLRHLDRIGEEDLADLAFTLQAGRERFEHRAALVCGDIAEARRRLADGSLLTRHEPHTERAVGFVLPAAASLDPALAAGLHQDEPYFRRVIETCLETSRPWAGDLRDAMFAGVPGDAVQRDLAVFSVEYALGRTFVHWGIRPDSYLGFGVGRYAAACLAGVLTLQDALALVAERARTGTGEPAGHLTEWTRRNVRLAAPHTPCVSGLTGTWIGARQATDPAFWAGPGPDRFDEATASILAEPSRVLVELGPGSVAERILGLDTARERLVIPALSGDGQDLLRTAVARLWLAGATIDWPSLHEGPRRRVAAPTYPFQRQRYWIDAGGEAGAPDPASALSLPREHPDDWFSIPVWHQAAPRRREAPPTGDWIVLTDAAGLGDRLRESLTAAGCRVTVARPGDRYLRTGDEVGLRIDRDDFSRLLSEVRPGRDAALNVVHLWTLDELDDTPEKVDRAFYSLMYLAQALGDSAIEDCRLSIVSSGAHDVTGGDVVDPCAATVTGPARVVPLENPFIRCRQIDLPRSEALPAAGPVLDEICTPFDEPLVALRGGRRWLPAQQRLEPVAVPEPAEVLRKDGVYLITGGLGGIGLALARRLFDEVGARLALVGRGGLPAAASDGADHRSEAVRELRAAGAEVLVLRADVSRVEEVRKVIADVQDRFGRIDGVIHAAGLPGVGLTQFKTSEDAAKVLAPKVAGAENLRACLSGVPLDFLVLFSSTTALTGGGPGQIDYCAANAYLDACGHAARAGDDPPTFSVGWGEWQWNAWDDSLAGFDEAAMDFLRQNRERVGITFDEGWAAFLRVLAERQPQVGVSPQDLPALIAATSALRLADLVGTGAGGERHPRPELATPYVAPDGDLSCRVAGIWAETLGLTEVGLHDNFFELGGNSLLGVTMIGRIRRSLDCPSLPPHVLYEAPTVAALAECVRRGEDAPDGGDGQAGLRGERRRQALGRRGVPQ